MPTLLGTKLLSLAILLLGSSIHRSDANPISSTKLLDIAANLKSSEDGNQAATAIEAESHYEVPMKRSNLRARRDTFTPNGCSIPFGLPWFFKDEFTPACNSHDSCYHYSEDTRKGCDEKFYQDMLEICDDTQSTDKKVKKCKKSAKTYYNAVRAFGGSRYGRGSSG